MSIRGMLRFDRRHGCVRRLASRLWPMALVPLAAGVLVVGVAGQASGVAARSSARTCKSPTAQPPNVGSDTQLFGVAATSRCKAWAVGSYVNHGHTRTLIEHWNGNAWKVFRSPNPGGSTHPNELRAVARVPGHAWAVGDYYNGALNKTLVEHWNGKAWKVQPTPNPGNKDNRLSGVAVVSATNAWAVGSYIYKGTPYLGATLILHWNGTAWVP